ncbi:hypothetical protein FB107DRAFT_294026 [Schizophyllum commune]
MEILRDGGEFDSFLVFPVRRGQVDTNNVLQVARHPGGATHKPPGVPAGGHVYGIPCLDEQGYGGRLNARSARIPPNLPTFRWAGLGRGPPRSDPEICDAGLEDWAATRRGLSSTRITNRHRTHLPVSIFLSDSTARRCLTRRARAITSTDMSRDHLLPFTTVYLNVAFSRCASVDRTTSYMRERAAVPPLTADVLSGEQDDLTTVLFGKSALFLSSGCALLNEGIEHIATQYPRPLSLVRSAPSQACERCRCR